MDKYELLKRCPHCHYDFAGKYSLFQAKWWNTCPNCGKNFVRGKYGFQKIGEQAIPLAIVAAFLIVLAWYEFSG